MSYHEDVDQLRFPRIELGGRIRYGFWISFHFRAGSLIRSQLVLLVEKQQAEQAEIVASKTLRLHDAWQLDVPFRHQNHQNQPCASQDARW